MRYFYFKAQYWNFQNFTWDALDQARSERKWLIKKIKSIKENKEKWEIKDRKELFLEALSDNINTPKLLSVLHLALTNWWSDALWAIEELEEKILKIGLFEGEELQEIPEEIITMAEERKQAKINKDYTLADELRNKIQEKWWIIKDNKDWYELQKV